MDADTARKRAGTICGYSDLTQPELAAKAGLDYMKWLKPVLSQRGKEIDTEDLVRLAQAAEVPTWFARHGWDGAAVSSPNDVADRLLAQEAQSVVLRERLRRLEAEVRRRFGDTGPASDPSP